MRNLRCRSCNNSLTNTFVDLGMSPLSNAFVRFSKLNEPETTFPLHVFVCQNCFLVQLEEFQTPDNIFTDYPYLSSYSDSWLNHSKQFVDMIINRLGLNYNSFVIEVASNDGYLLQYFKRYNIPALGIEPAENVAEIAREKGIDTQCAFFNSKTAQELVEKDCMADLIICNNVLAHVPNLNDFVSALKIILKSKGVITVEFPHLLKLIQENQFDTIYHEHFSYFSLLTVIEVLNSVGLEAFDVEEIPTHGGSLRIYIKHKNDLSKSKSISINRMLEKEKHYGLNDIKTYFGFAEKVKETKRQLLELLIKIKNDQKSIVGYGAPAKGNTLLNYCGIGTDFLEYTVDLNPVKQGMYLPGTHIPIFSPDKLRETKPEYILLLPWNLKSEVIEQISYVKEWGCKIIIPIPKLMVV